MPTIVQVSASRGGVPKRAIPVGRITVNGVEGDSWAHPEIHGGPFQAVLLLAEEALDALRLAGFPVFPGALGENLTTRGIDPHAWRAGQVWRVGSALLELTKIRTPCSTIKIYGDAIGRAVYDAQVSAGDHSSALWGYSGFYAKVLREGVVRGGDAISLERETA